MDEAIKYKEHIPRTGEKKALCGRKGFSSSNPKGVILLPEDWHERSIDTYVFCSQCKGMYFKQTGETQLPQEKDTNSF